MDGETSTPQERLNAVLLRTARSVLESVPEEFAEKVILRGQPNTVMSAEEEQAARKKPAEALPKGKEPPTGPLVARDMIELNFNQRIAAEGQWETTGGVALEASREDPKRLRLKFTVADELDVQKFAPSALAIPMLDDLAAAMHAKEGGDTVKVEKYNLREWQHRGGKGQTVIMEFDASFLEKAQEAVLEMSKSRNIRVPVTSNGNGVGHESTWAASL
jgi:hypothetical protein